MKSINIQFPLRDDTARNNYFLMNQITKDAFSSDLLFLLLTEKGQQFIQKIISEATKHSNVARAIGKKEITTEIFVPGKLINLILSSSN